MRIKVLLPMILVWWICMKGDDSLEHIEKFLFSILTVLVIAFIKDD